MNAFFVFLGAVAVLMLAFMGESVTEHAMRVFHRGRCVMGEVLAVDKVAYSRDRYYGVHLLLKTGQGKLSVHLGPSWFVNSQMVKIAPHDVIEVTGSPATYGGRPALIAAKVRKGNDVLRLRAGDGSPLWHGSRTL